MLISRLNSHVTAWHLICQLCIFFLTLINHTTAAFFRGYRSTVSSFGVIGR